MTVLDFDDFRRENSRLDLLDELKRRVTDLKVTLFTIPMSSCGWMAHMNWLAQVREERPWIELAMHGLHHDYLECSHWDQPRSLTHLLAVEETGIFVPGFKAPYWETSPGLYAALIERNWWIADHPKNISKRPAGLRVYELDRSERVHGHIQNVCGNGLEEKFEYYTSLKGPFQFVSEVMCTIS